jgi:hypothetical protein
LGNILQGFGLAGGAVGLATSEFGGEAILPDAVAVFSTGSRLSTLGATISGYAQGGATGALASFSIGVITDQMSSGVANAALGGVLGEAVLKQVENAFGAFAEGLSAVHSACGPE